MDTSDHEDDGLDDIFAMVYDEGHELHQRDTIRFVTRVQRQWAWKAFVDYFEHVRSQNQLAQLPGSPTDPSDYLDRGFAHLDFRTSAAMMTHWATGAIGQTRDPAEEDPFHVSAPNLESGRALWRMFRKHYADVRGEDLPEDVATSILLYLRQDMIDNGTLVKHSRRRTLTDGDGCKAIARAALAPTFSPWNGNARMEVMLWLAIELQTGLRGGASFPKTRHADDDASCMTFGCFKFHLIRGAVGSNTNEITLEYAPPRNKTETTQFGSHIVVTTPELWRDPIFLMIVVATIKGVLPMSLTEMYDPRTLRGEKEVTVAFKDEDANLPVCTTLGGDSWTVGMLDWHLQKLSAIAGFEKSITKHAFRRMVALFLRARGAPLEVISSKLGHRFKSTVTECYMNQMTPVDIASMVFSTSSRILEAMSLHPDMLKSNPNARVALPGHTRLAILTSQEFIEKKHAVEEIKQELKQTYGSLSNLPNDENRSIKSAWNALWSYYYKAYRTELAKIIKNDTISSSFEDSQILDSFPDDGSDCDYDAGATAGLLGSLELNNAADLQQYVDEQEQMEEEDELDNTDVCEEEISSVNLQDESDAVDDVEDLRKVVKQRDNLSAIAAYLFAPRQDVDLNAALTSCTTIPKLASQIGGYRPQHLPINGVCPGCQLPLSEVVVVKAKRRDEVWRLACIRHVHACVAKHLLDVNLPVLLDTYPSALTEHPCPPIGYGRRKNPNLNLYNLVGTLQSRQTTICACGASLGSFSLVVAHYLVDCPKFKIWFPAGSNSNREKINALKAGEWSQRIAGFPLPTYYFRDHSYHYDPCELESYARQYYKERFIDATLNVKSYGLRDDCEIPDGVLLQDRTGNESDHKYDVGLVRGRIVTNDGFCFLCVTDPLSSATSKMTPGHDTGDHGRHVRIHLINTLHTARRYREEEARGFEDAPEKGKKPIKVGSVSKDGGAGGVTGIPEAGSSTGPGTTQHVDEDISDPSDQEGEEDSKDTSSKFWLLGHKKKHDLKIERKKQAKPFILTESGFRCPDVVCLRNGREFTDELTWTQHLCLVHNLPIKNSGIGAKVTSYEQLCFVSQSELDTQLQQGDNFLKKRKSGEENHKERKAVRRVARARVTN